VKKVTSSGKLMGDNPWECCWSTRPIFKYCLESASQVEETYWWLDYTNIRADQDHADIKGRLDMVGYTEEKVDELGPCPMEGYFLLTQLESLRAKEKGANY
jgi:hypothetical protein